MRKHFMLTGIFLLLHCTVFLVSASAQDSTKVRVGIYENQPKVFTDSQGNVSGFWPDIIAYIASNERWRVEYSHGTWQQCLEQLRNSEIDMMPDVAFSEERNKVYGFSKEPVYTSWSGVYTRKGSDVEGVLDLAGKNIAVLKGSINFEAPGGIRDLLNRFGINCVFTEVDSYVKVFELVKTGRADAGVVSKDFAYLHEEEFDLVPTPIIFQPARLHFAFPKGADFTPSLIAAVDRRVIQLKEDRQSIYYRSLEKWFGVEPANKPVIPGWAKLMLLGIGGLALLLLGANVVLKSQVRSKTSELRQDIARRKLAEESTRRYDQELTIRNRIANIFLTTPDEEMYNQVLKVLLDALDSEYGAFGYIDEEGALVVPSMNRQVWNECQVAEKNYVFPRHRWGDSSWPRCIRERKAICINQPSTKTPKGHVAIKRHMSLPVIHRGEVIGLIQVANKKRDYDEEDVRLLKILGDAIAPVLHARLAGQMTERQRARAEEALQKSDERFRQVAENAQEWIWETDSSGLYTYASPVVEKTLGYKPEEIVGVKHFYDLLHPEDRKSVKKKAFEVFAKKQSFRELINRNVHRDGSMVWLSTSGVPVLDREGNLVGYRGADIDITDRKRAEEALSASEVRYRRLFETAKDGILILNAETGMIMDVNPFLMEMLGFSHDQLTGKAIWDIGLFKDIASNQNKFMELQRQGYVRYKNLPLETVYGRRIEVEFISNLYTVNHQKVIQCNIRDITDRIQAQDQLKKALLDQERSNRELEQFAYVVSHDLQEPLRMVSSYTQLLRRRYKDKLDQDADEFITFAVDGAARMQRLITDLLMYSRVGTRGKPPQPTDCGRVLTQTLANLRTAITESQAVVTNDDLPSIMADETQMVQLFQNLIGNAIKFHGDRPPRIHLSARQEEDGWLFSVKDNGIGIDPAQGERIFVVFRRLHQRDEYPGTGIGLSICKKIVERHGGRIWVEPNPDSGSVFYFTIPSRGGEVSSPQDTELKVAQPA